MTFQEYQSAATKLPASLRNDRDRFNLPLTGLQEETGRIGQLLTHANATGSLDLGAEQRNELRDRLADSIWYIALLCGETGMSMQDMAAHSLTLLQKRFEGLDSDRR